MADILIRGMEMPHDCPHCEFAAIGYASPMSSGCTLYCRAVDKFKDCATEIMKDNSYEKISQYDTRPDWCPLVPLPEGHGRLVDLDALINELHNLLDKREKDAAFSGDREAGVTWDDAINKIIAAPIIIPAEGGADDGN